MISSPRARTRVRREAGPAPGGGVSAPRDPERRHDFLLLFDVTDGDHSFNVRIKVAGRRPEAVLVEIFDTVAAFTHAGAD